MGIDRHIIGLYGVCSMVGIEVRGMGRFGLRLGWSVGLLEWVVGGSGYSNPDCNTLLHQNPARLNPEEPCPMTVPTPHQGLRGCHLGRYRMPHYPLSRE